MPHMILATLTSSHHHLLKESANKPSRCIMWPNFLKVAKFHREFSIKTVPFSKNWTNKVQCSKNFWFTLYKLANSNFVRFDEVGDDIENTFWELATFIEKHVLKVWTKRTRKCRHVFRNKPLSWSFLLSSTFENKKFVDNAQQCFAFTPQANFPAHILNFHWRWRWWDRMQAIFLNLFYFIVFT